MFKKHRRSGIWHDFNVSSWEGGSAPFDRADNAGKGTRESRLGHVRVKEPVRNSSDHTGFEFTEDI